MKKPDRGVRNNNPGNIEKGQPWQGLSPTQTDPRFAQFIDPRYGIRAIAVILINYQDKHGIHTIRGAISRWAPPAKNGIVENNTEAYIMAVVRAVKQPAGALLDFHEYDVLRPLVEAIIAHENSGYKYPKVIVDAGLKMAGVISPHQNMLARPEAVGGAVGGVGVTAQMFTETAQQMNLMGAESPTVKFVCLGLMFLGFLIGIAGLVRKAYHRQKFRKITEDSLMGLDDFDHR